MNDLDVGWYSREDMKKILHWSQSFAFNSYIIVL